MDTNVDVKTIHHKDFRSNLTANEEYMCRRLEQNFSFLKWVALGKPASIDEIR